jgi:hypothetical protein
MASLV